jgi:hypothetical protein
MGENASETVVGRSQLGERSEVEGVWVEDGSSDEEEEQADLPNWDGEGVMMEEALLRGPPLVPAEVGPPRVSSERERQRIGRHVAALLRRRAAAIRRRKESLREWVSTILASGMVRVGCGVRNRQRRMRAAAAAGAAADRAARAARALGEAEQEPLGELEGKRPVQGLRDLVSKVVGEAVRRAVERATRSVEVPCPGDDCRDMAGRLVQSVVSAARRRAGHKLKERQLMEVRERYAKGLSVGRLGPRPNLKADRVARDTDRDVVGEALERPGGREWTRDEDREQKEKLRPFQVRGETEEVGRFTFHDAFCGMGGGTLGFTQAGGEC